MTGKSQSDVYSCPSDSPIVLVSLGSGCYLMISSTEGVFASIFSISHGIGWSATSGGRTGGKSSSGLGMSSCGGDRPGTQGK